MQKKKAGRSVGDFLERFSLEKNCIRGGNAFFFCIFIKNPGGGHSLAIDNNLAISVASATTLTLYLSRPP